MCCSSLVSIHFALLSSLPHFSPICSNPCSSYPTRFPRRPLLPFPSTEPFPSLYLQVRQNMSGRCFDSPIGDAPRHRNPFPGWFSQLSSLLHSGTPGSETRLHPSVFCSGLILFGSRLIDIPPRTLDPNTHFYKRDYFLVTKTNASHSYTIYTLK